MSKKRATADLIKAQMEIWIATAADANSCCTDCPVPRPVALSVPEDGCNWTTAFIRVPPECQALLHEVIIRAKREYDLAI